MAEGDTMHELYSAWMSNDWSAASAAAVENYYLGSETDRDCLRSLLTPRISFGTAGLRAEMLPGFANFNHVTVRQAILGLADYLVEQSGNDAYYKGVIVGHDHRAMPEPFEHPKFKPARPKPFIDNHFSSARLAQLVIATLEANGFKTTYLGECHTPLVSFAVRDQQASAGVMITASHNPKTYNGLKVYWGNGCQINHPHDEGIARAISDNLGPPDLQSLRERDDVACQYHAEYVQAIRSRYNTRLLQRVGSVHAHARIAPVVATPLHGVGMYAIESALRECGWSTGFISWVDAQKHPDARFPTVRFPNPEEEGALDAAAQHADEEKIKTIVAVDPDADRFAAAEKRGNIWHRFTGNQMGILLAVFALQKQKQRGIPKRLAMLTTTVSSMALSKIAAQEDFHCEETLTGFKWMSNRAQELEEMGFEVLFAYEEALGYMFTDVIYDKDGVAALLKFLAARQTWATEEGVTPFQKLEKIYEKYGYFADANTYLTSPDAATTDRVFKFIRNSQMERGAGTKEKPAVLNGIVCKRYRDLTTGVDTAKPNGKPVLPVDPKTHMITCEVSDGRFTIRGSGTEPKVKLYVECQGSSLEDAQTRADQLRDLIIEDWLHLLKKSSSKNS